MYTGIQNAFSWEKVERIKQMSVFVGRSAMHIANTDDLTTNINGVQQLGSKNDKKIQNF